MLKRGLGHTLFVLALLTFCAASAAADSRARIVRLSFVEGNVQMDQRDGRGFQKAFLNMPIGQGTILLTRDEGRAEVEFENGSTIRIARDSQLEFQQLGLRTAGNKFSAIDITEGTAYFDIKKKSEDEFVVTVNGQQITAPKDARFRLRAGKDGANLAVFKGEIDFDTGGGKQVEVRKNESIELDAKDSNRYFLSREITTDPLDAWDLEREKYRDQYFAASSYAYNPAYSYGYADLAYWGSMKSSRCTDACGDHILSEPPGSPTLTVHGFGIPAPDTFGSPPIPGDGRPIATVHGYSSKIAAGAGVRLRLMSRGSRFRFITTRRAYFAPPVFPIDRRHHEPILIGNGGPGPVHPGGDGRVAGIATMTASGETAVVRAESAKLSTVAMFAPCRTRIRTAQAGKRKSLMVPTFVRSRTMILPRVMAGREKRSFQRS